MKHKDKKIESLGIETIEPTGVLMEKLEFLAVGGKFDDGTITFGLDTFVIFYILPVTVNFKNIKVSEGEVAPTVTGYFDPDYKEDDHPASRKTADMAEFEEGKGTKSKEKDQVKLVFDKLEDESLTDGSFIWNIPWYYHFDDMKKEFTKVEQKAMLEEINATKYKYTLSKGEALLYYYINPVTGVRTSNVFARDGKEVRP